MKKLIVSLAISILIQSIVYAQININPDPNGDPIIVGDVEEDCGDIFFDVEEMEITSISNSALLPTFKYNDTNVFMPPYKNQGATASCTQFAEVWHTFTYEINRKRNISAGTLESRENLYYPHYTYNFLNNGNANTRTCSTTGFRIIKENGSPTYDIFYDDSLTKVKPRVKYWMDGEDKYISAMKNKVNSIKRLSWTNSLNSLNNLKHWLSDHNAGETTGGLSVVVLYMEGETYGSLPAGTPEEFKRYIRHLNQNGDGAHAITIVGYNDDVCCIDAFEPFGRG